MENKVKILQLIEMYERAYLYLPENRLMSVMAELSDCMSRLLLEKNIDIGECLTEILQAMAKKDYVYINDLLQYKLKQVVQRL